LSIERYPFSAKNQTLRSYRVLYIFRLRSTVGIITSYSYTWAQFGGGHGGRVPLTFSDGGT